MKFFYSILLVCQVQGRVEQEYFNPVLALESYLNSEYNEKESSSLEIINLISDISISDAIVEVIQNSRAPRIIKTNLDFAHNPSKKAHLILFIRNFISFCSSISVFESTRSHYTIVVKEITEVEMKIVFEKLWFKSILNLNILKIEENCEKMYTFKPFQHNKCHSTQPILINEFINGSWESTNFFPEKLSNLFNCTLKVCFRFFRY